MLLFMAALDAATAVENLQNPLRHRHIRNPSQSYCRSFQPSFSGTKRNRSPMNIAIGDPYLRELSTACGIETEWTDNDGVVRKVSEETQRLLIKSLGLDGDSRAQIRDSLAHLRSERDAIPSFKTMQVHRKGALRFHDSRRRHAQIVLQNGDAFEFEVRDRGDGHIEIPAIDIPGYHTLHLGSHVVALAVAPPRCYTIDDACLGKRIYGVAAQLYGLRHSGKPDAEQSSVGLRGMGSGDFGALAELVREAAGHGADAVGLSPAHALFTGDVSHYSPYSPSNRLFLNVLLADPLATFDTGRIGAAIAEVGLEDTARELDARELIDWPRTGAARLKLLRALFESYAACELSQPEGKLAREFALFRREGGAALEAHAQFEVLHAQEFARDFTNWHWRTWRSELCTQDSPLLQKHKAENEKEITFNIFTQWLAARSFATAKSTALHARMKIGLIGDLAVGLNDGGSQAWQSPQDFLAGLSIGAPPDALAPKGQDWGLSAFSPRALQASGYAPFINMLRATMRYCGGLRIDHVMGLARLWLIPSGAGAGGGAYLRYPLDDMLALIALESVRHRCVIIGEDLGTVPPGFREKLGNQGLAGLRVLLFERDGPEFRRPEHYPRDAVAMTTTHDTATFAGWWKGHDLAVRDVCAQLPPGQTRQLAEAERVIDKDLMEKAFTEIRPTEPQSPLPADLKTPVDNAIAFAAHSAAQLVIVPLEDITGQIEQPNLPGTTAEHPNWRRRYRADSRGQLRGVDACNRLNSLAQRSG
jgi:4-alpha-glucanotransferase